MSRIFFERSKMFIVHGHYSFGTRKSSCMNDYCTHCRRGTFTEGFRSFRVMHIYWVPLVPMGFQTDWWCTSCGNDPRSRRPMSRGLALVGFVLCVSALLGVCLAPQNAIEAEAKWGMTAVFGGMVALTGYSLFGKKRSEYLALRKAVEPLRSDVCPYCEAPTVRLTDIRCERCDITIAQIL